jgi:hypothetical protein
MPEGETSRPCDPVELDLEAGGQSPRVLPSVHGSAFANEGGHGQ